LICLYLYQYLSLWDASYIVGNKLMSTFQHKFNCANLFSCSWDISRQSFYSYWCPDISVICCCFCTFHICADSPHLGLSSTTWFVKISPLVVEIQAEWSLWQNSCINLGYWPSHFKKLLSIIIPKPNKSLYDTPKTFCPIDLLNTLEKLIEKVISSKLQIYLKQTWKHLQGFLYEPRYHSYHIWCKHQ